MATKMKMNKKTQDTYDTLSPSRKVWVRGNVWLVRLPPMTEKRAKLVANVVEALAVSLGDSSMSEDISIVSTEDEVVSVKPRTMKQTRW